MKYIRIHEINRKKSVVQGEEKREFVTWFMLQALAGGADYPRSIHQQLQAQFPEKVHSYDYICKIANQLAEAGLLLKQTEVRKNLFTLTEKGKERLRWYDAEFGERVIAVKEVVDRFLRELTGSGQPAPVVGQLPDAYRSYFSKLVSVKDLIRYVTLKHAGLRPVYMSEIRDILQDRYGWESSNSYLYDLAHEMEANGLLAGRWENEKRTRRFLTLTDEGRHHFKQIEENSRERLQSIQHFLGRMAELSSHT